MITTTTAASDLRMDKAIALSKQVTVEYENENENVLLFKVPSQTNSGKTYEVSLLGGKTYVCTCPDFEYRYEVDTCKHIKAVQLYRARTAKITKKFANSRQMD